MSEDRGQKVEFGLRPLGAIGASAPEGMGKVRRLKAKGLRQKGLETGASMLESGRIED